MHDYMESTLPAFHKHNLSDTSYVNHSYKLGDTNAKHTGLDDNKYLQSDNEQSPKLFD